MIATAQNALNLMCPQINICGHKTSETESYQNVAFRHKVFHFVPLCPILFHQDVSIQIVILRQYHALHCRPSRRWNRVDDYE